MKNLIAVLAASAGLLIGVVADAQPADDTNGVVITSDLINRLVAEARTNNPSVLAADFRVKSAEINAEAVRTWADPMFMVGGTTFSPRGMNPAMMGDLAYGVEQKLPLWGLPGLTRRVAQTGSAMEEADLNYRIQQLRRDISKQLLATALAERVVKIGEQDLAWLDVTAKAVESRYRSGDAVLADTLQIQNELAERNDQLRTDRHLLAHERFNLNRLLNRDPESSWPSLRLPPVAPAIPLSEKLLTLALANEPKLKVMDEDIKQAKAAADVTRRSRLPDVSLGIEGREYSGDGGFRSGDFTLRFSLPWFNEGKYHKDYQRDIARQRTAEQERDDQVLTVREELHHLSVDIDASRRQALLYNDQITERAAQALDSRLSDWETGHGTFRDVLDARRMLLDSELTAARATAEENGMLDEMLLWTGLDNLESLVPLASEPPIISEHDNH